jgi:hypothetical protein
LGARHSLRPLFGGQDKNYTSREKSRGEIADSRHCEAQRDEAIHSCFAARWIASRSLSSGAHSRDPLARNDDLLFEN